MKKENLSAGKKAALYRAKLLTDVLWTPERDIKVYTKTAGITKLPAGEAVKGMIYSSTEPTDKFVTENISFETFASIVNNPDSALYLKDLNGHNNSWPYFGIVCNGLVRYALNIRRRYSTKRWRTVPGMRLIAEGGCYKVEDIEICDVLCAYGSGRNHVSMITDIIYDDNGKITGIEISEAIRPSCARRIFPADDFTEKFNLYALFRYDYIDSVPMPDAEDIKFIEGKVEKTTPDIALDYGNKTNYRTNEDVLISVFNDGENEIELCKEGETVEIIKISGRGNVAKRLPRGNYTVKLKNTGTVLEFAVHEPKISYSVKDGMLYVEADPMDELSKISHMEFRENTGKKALKDRETTDAVFYDGRCAPLSKLEELTDEEKETGKFARKIPEDAGNFKVTFVNRYGMWTHTMIEI